MVAEFAQTKVILIAGHQVTPQSCFGLTIAVSPRDEDALANPTLPSQHVLLIQELVTQLAPPLISGGVLWQRAKAPISVEAVERIAEALSDKLAEMEEISSTVPHGARSIETAQWLPSSALALQL
jgi:hypothetical protein